MGPSGATTTRCGPGSRSMGALGLVVPEELGWCRRGPRRALARRGGAGARAHPGAVPRLRGARHRRAPRPRPRRSRHRRRPHRAAARARGGERIGAVAVGRGPGEWDRTGGATTATERAGTAGGGAGCSTASRPRCSPATSPTSCSCSPARPTGPGWFAVDAGADGLTRTRLAGLDPTRRVAKLALRRHPGARGSPPPTPPRCSTASPTSPPWRSPPSWSGCCTGRWS
jgi:acyl-CoA dehydrogenase